MKDTFAGRYALGEVLGSGGSGLVRSAHDAVLDREVAIKLLRAGANDHVLRSRLRSEAQLAGGLHHPGIAQIYDFGEAELDGEPTPYIAMQLVEGTSLWSLLRDRRTLPVAEVLDLLVQIGTALQAAHDRGIVHRDLKPSNVLVTDSGRAMLVDFGIARTADADPLTGTGTIVGTADYVSPEQCAGQSATPRSDIYGLGMLAYECLSGCKPFHRETAVATALAHLNDEAPPLTDVPAPVAELVAAMIEKDPADRPASAAEVAARAAALVAADGGTTDLLPTVGSLGPETLPPPPTPLREAAVARPPWQRLGSSSRRIQIAAAAVAITLLGVMFVAARPGTSEVPDLDGMSWAQAEAALADAGLSARREAVDDVTAERNEVLSQSPKPGASVAEDAVVVVTVASGRTTVDPSSVVGLPYAAAARVLVEQGLVPLRRDVVRPGADGRTVVTVVPAGRVDVGSTITLNVGVEAETATPAPEPATSGSGGSSGSGGENGGKGGNGHGGDKKPGKSKKH